MPKKRKLAKSRLREKPARGPQPFSARYEGVISKYLTEVAEQRTEPARSHRFSQLLAELFSDIEQPLVKTGGRLIEHARYYWVLLAESHLTRRLFASMLCRIAALPSPAG